MSEVAATQRPSPEIGEPLPTSPSAEPLDLARSFIQHWSMEGVPTIRRWRGEWWRWPGSAYVVLTDEEVRAEVYAFLETVHIEGQGQFKPRQRHVSEVIDAATAIAQIGSDVEPPCWLNGDGLPIRDIVPVNNGFIYLPTLGLRKPTPKLWAHAASDVAYDRDAPEPERWLAFVEQLWPNDPESIDTLQEEMGYLLSGRTDLQKIFIFVGPRRAGKGTILHIIRRLVGTRNVVAPALGGLGQPFGLAPLIGKAVALISDARISGRADLPAVVETLLRVSGEDVVTVPRKFRPDWTGRLGARFVIASNELPRLDDASGALASRLVPLLLDRSFYGREDHSLLPALESELPGIMLWALDGLRRLRERGRFLVPATASEVMRDMRALASPVSAFVEEDCCVGPEDEVSVQDIYQAYRRWCETQGLRPSSKEVFGRDLMAAVPGVRVIRRRVGELRVRFYGGLKLSDSAAPAPSPNCQRCGGEGCEWCP